MNILRRYLFWQKPSTASMNELVRKDFHFLFIKTIIKQFQETLKFKYNWQFQKTKTNKTTFNTQNQHYPPPPSCPPKPQFITGAQLISVGRGVFTLFRNLSKDGLHIFSMGGGLHIFSNMGSQHFDVGPKNYRIHWPCSIILERLRKLFGKIPVYWKIN